MLIFNRDGLTVHCTGESIQSGGGSPFPSIVLRHIGETTYIVWEVLFTSVQVPVRIVKTVLSIKKMCIFPYEFFVVCLHGDQLLS